MPPVAAVPVCAGHQPGLRVDDVYVERAAQIAHYDIASPAVVPSRFWLQQARPPLHRQARAQKGPARPHVRLSPPPTAANETLHSRPAGHPIDYQTLLAAALSRFVGAACSHRLSVVQRPPRPLAATLTLLGRDSPECAAQPTGNALPRDSSGAKMLSGPIQHRFSPRSSHFVHAVQILRAGTRQQSCSNAGDQSS